MTTAAFVPARSGSKRVPGKNIKPLAGKPLVLWTLGAFINAPSIDTVIFSTDSEAYWDLACRTFGKEKFTLDFRSPDEAGDKVKIFDYLKDAHTKIFSADITTFVMGLPTVPFRQSAHVEDAVALYREKKRPVFSATDYGFPVSFAFHINDTGNWQSLVEPNPMNTGNTRSQDQRTAYHPNGAIYVRAVKDLSDSNLKTLYQNAVPYLMDRKFSVDIDNEADFAVAAAMVNAGIFS